MNFEMTAKMFKALGDPTRLRIVSFLADCCCGRAAIRENGDVEEPTAGEVCCQITGLPKITSTISHHLHELESAGIITMRRNGKSMHCCLNATALLEVERLIRKFHQGETS